MSATLTHEEAYLLYRGKCKELSEAVCASDLSLRLVRGHYLCPIWGKQEHWWTEHADGTVYDPTKDQFPSRGIGEYVEFDGWCECEQCGKEIREEDAHFAGLYPCCSDACCLRLVGL